MYKILDEKYTWKEAINLQDAEWVLPNTTDLEQIRDKLPRLVNFWTLEECTDDRQFAIVFESNYGKCFQIKPATERVILLSNGS